MKKQKKKKKFFIIHTNFKYKNLSICFTIKNYESIVHNSIVKVDEYAFI